MPPEFAGPWPPETDVPQVGFKEPPDHHEAYWLYGYDPASEVGHYLYLAAEKDDVLLRRESIFMLLPDGSVLAQNGAGRNSRGTTAAGDRLQLECLEPFRRWRGHYAAPVHRLAGDEVVAGPRPGSELVEAVIDVEVESVAAPWNTEGDWGEPPPSLRYHQFYDAGGTVTVSGTAYPFAGPGFRSHSRRHRDMPGFTGHAIINGRFPSGRGFGLLRYRATAGRPERGRGFLYLDGVLHDADVVAWPHLDEAVPGGECAKRTADPDPVDLGPDHRVHARWAMESRGPQRVVRNCRGRDGGDRWRVGLGKERDGALHHAAHSGRERARSRVHQACGP